MLRVIVAINDTALMEYQAVNDGTGDVSIGHYDLYSRNFELEGYFNASEPSRPPQMLRKKIGRIENWNRGLGATALSHEILKIVLDKNQENA